jgi:pimeloyl-ACP methyl ester carboxylesterase
MELTGYSSFWKAVIRPPRCEYDIKDLGPKNLVIDGQRITRTDIDLKNREGNILKCSHFEPTEKYREWEEMPCVIYMHGNSSARIEALESVMVLLPANITVFCFDFAGCGMSEGEYISLGWWEREDLGLIVEYLRKERRVSTLGLWGRSMGAVTGLLYSDRDPSIAGMVLDSPFSKLSDLVDELARSYTKIPNFLVKGALKLIKQSVKSKAKFDLMLLNPIDHVDKAFIPAMFAHGVDDDFI